ncbi:MAG: PKD domain-containing protein, partial [Nitrospirae bacterium]
FYTFANLATYHDQGLLGLALDPSFPSAPWVYAYYSYDDVANGTTSNRIVRIQATGNSGGSMDVLLDGIPSGVWHIGGPIQFGPDGKLYAVIGDSYVWANAQNLTNVAGKVLRLNPDGSVPSDNPFVGNASANPYIYTYGHRNNFGIAFHPVTGAAYVTENGPECNDEVNLLIPGRNYGWGPSWTCVPPMPPPPLNTNRDGPNPVLPLVWYSPNIAPTNAIFYDGPDFAAWQGDFFFGTWNTRNVHRLHLAPPNYDSVVSDDVVLTLPSSASGGVVEVEQGLDGAIWLTDPDTIYRFYDTLAPPVASFTVSSSTPLAVDVVTFNGSASYDSDGSIESYAWDFGDGSSASGALVTHGYATYGVYNATLVVRDFDNLTGSQTTSIRVLAMPTASFAFGPPKPLEGAAVTFDASNSTDPDGSITDYQWDWGDGSGSAVSVSSVAQHTFATFGQYAVNLTVTDSDGLTNTDSLMIQVYASPAAVLAFSPFSPRAGEAVTLDGTGSSDADGTIVQYAWDFGDGATASGPTVAHTFAAGNYSVTLTVSIAVVHAYPVSGLYTVTLTVLDNDGLANSTTQDVQVNAPPVAAFAILPTAPFAGDAIAFDGSASRDPEGSLATFAWDFGDSTSGAAGMIVSHGYAQAGTYLVRLVVTDSVGLTDTKSMNVVVRQNQPPVAVLTPTPARVNPGQPISFDASGSTDSDGSIVSYSWSFGDGATADGALRVHAYTAPGTYTVALTVTDDRGAFQTAFVAVQVNAPPVASFAAIPGSTYPGLYVTFNASASVDSDSVIVSYHWDFGDGTTATGAVVVHAFADHGSFAVGLIVTDDLGAHGQATMTIEVGNRAPIVESTSPQDSLVVNASEST